MGKKRKKNPLWMGSLARLQAQRRTLLNRLKSIETTQGGGLDGGPEDSPRYSGQERGLNIDSRRKRNFGEIEDSEVNSNREGARDAKNDNIHSESASEDRRCKKQKISFEARHSSLESVRRQSSLEDGGIRRNDITPPRHFRRQENVRHVIVESPSARRDNGKGGLTATIDNEDDMNWTECKLEMREKGDYARRDGPGDFSNIEREQDRLQDHGRNVRANTYLEENELEPGCSLWDDKHEAGSKKALEESKDEPGCSFWDDKQRAGSKKDHRAVSDFSSRKSLSPERISSPEHTVSIGIKMQKQDATSHFKQISNSQECGDNKNNLPLRVVADLSKCRRRIKDLAVEDLKRLCSQDVVNGVIWLASRPDRLKDLVGIRDMTLEEVENLLRFLADVCEESDCFKGFLNLVLSVVADSKFFTKHLPEIIANVSLTAENDTLVKHTCILCSVILQHFPSKIVYVATVASLLHSQIAKQDNVPTDYQFRKITELNAKCTATMCESHIKDRFDEGNRFRNISIIPQTDEIRLHVKPKLNPNFKSGAYQNVNAYLDTQFRLLREDFVAPLRTGICAFIKQQHTGRTGRRVDDVRVYHDAMILHPVCGSDGVSYRVQFNRDKWSRRMLASNKLLRYGSLVCLSPDGFENVHFGVVTNRDHLSEGIINVQLHKSPEDSSIYECKYTMVESEAFFEAYRPVLKGLQRMTQDTLPFQKYIIKTSHKVSPPLFLQKSPEATFDLSCLDDQQLGLKNIDAGEGATEKGLPQGSNKPNRSCQSDPSKVPVLKYNKWPDGATIGLDESQRRALYAALTQELAIIQGPPGTGKTYVGLKIMKALLNNREVWSDDKREPILVVCYTNHALDQFLEGVLQFEKDIIRIGSRSKSEKLAKYNLRDVRYAKTFAMHTQRREYHFHIKPRMFKLRNEKKEEIESKANQAMAFKQEIVSFEKLECVMGRHHVDSLLARRAGKGVPVMSKWLDLEPFLVAYSNSSLLFEKSRENRNKEHSVFAEHDVPDERQLDDELYTSRNLPQTSLPRAQQGLAEDFVLRKFKSLADKIEEPAKRESKLKTAKIIEGKMKSSERMSDFDAASVKDVWRLSPEDKWKLYRHWLNAYRSICLGDTIGPAFDYDRYAHAIKDIENEEIYRILKDVNVIGMTTTGAAKHQSILQRVGPRIVVVEEAAEVMEAHIITALSQHCQHLILIGDHQQLRPNPAVYRLAKQYNLDISFFERMINNSFPHQTLVRQHRMRPEIAEIMRNHFYPDLQDDSSVLSRENVRGVWKNIFFLNHGYMEDSNDDGMKSHSSQHEADFTVALCNYLLQQGYSPSQVTILTVYTGQLLSIKSKLAEKGIKDVRTAVVDNYQGEECDIILLSLVRSNEEEKIGFLQTHNRVCVMLSRARMGLFCVGNFVQLASKSEKWKAITNEMRQKRLLDNSLVLACSLHLDVKTEVTCAADFKKVPDGGCSRPCEFRLSCGHVCTRLCHPDDRSHERFKCDKPCEREICKNKHKCTKSCGEDCLKICEKKVKIRLPGCSHEATMKCYSNPDYFKCDAKCQRQLPCGHGCQKKCGKPCTKWCLEKVLRTDLPCGHKQTMPCSDTNDQCPAACGTVLACGHKCPGKCSFCVGGRLHASCRIKCGRILLCGHQCKAPCAGNCPPCLNPCENRCLHSRCPKKCSEPCSPCQEPCRWRCPHYSCSKKCSEPCDRPPCNQPCKKKLKCKHPCIGMCGEPCPSLCRICDNREVTEIFFGNEDQDDARFVKLEDCHHVIEVSGLDRWMMQDSFTAQDDENNQETSDDGRSSTVIQLKSCPKCKTPIRRSTRYNGIINKMLADIDTIKGQILGNTDLVAQRKREIESLLPQVEKSGCFVIPSVIPSLTSSVFDLTVFLNQTRFAVEVIKLRKQLDNLAAHSTRKSNTEKEFFKVRHRLFNPSRPFRGTEQELIDFPREIRRIQLCCQACSILDASTPESPEIRQDLQVDMENVDKLLFSIKPLTPEIEKEAQDLLEKLRQKVGGLGISNETRIMIVKAIGLSKGHWYKCPNGHVYAIGECGGATERAICPECKASIGGTQHQLTSGNTVAPEMDGARYAAWSEQANLANYEFL